MRAYLIRRLVLIIPTLFILSVLVFLSVRFIPGDVIDVMVGRMEAELGGGELDREALERRLGLDVPVYVQYGRWLGGIFLHGTLGESLFRGWAVEEKIIGRLPVTVELGTSTLVGNNPARLREGLCQVLDGTYKHGKCPELWDGKAAERIARVLVCEKAGRC